MTFEVNWNHLPFLIIVPYKEHKKNKRKQLKK
jgi:hypothetical protein